MSNRAMVRIACAAAAIGACSADACTIFRITIAGRTLMGNNEAWNDPATKVWFFPAEPGKHGRVLFGYRNAYAQGGMNDQGLCYDWVAGYPNEWARDDSKPDTLDNLGERMLEHASSVDEAIAIFESCNYPGFSSARALIVDRSGDSAILGFEQGKLVVRRAEGCAQTLGWDEEAADARLRALCESGEASLTVEDAVLAASSVLGSCVQSGAYTTFYSNVYDTSSGEVHIFQFAGDVPQVTLNLADELAKGPHYYDLPDIHDQLASPPATDTKTMAETPPDPEACNAIAGAYEAPGGIRIDFWAQDGRPMVRLPGEPEARPVHAASSTEYFLRVADVRFTFTISGDSRAATVTVKTWETTFEAQRVGDAAPTRPAGAPGP